MKAERNMHLSGNFLSFHDDEKKIVVPDESDGTAGTSVIHVMSSDL